MRLSRGTPAAVCLALGLCACPGGGGYGSTTGAITRRPTTASGAGGPGSGAASTSGASITSGASSGSSSGGTTSGDCATDFLDGWFDGGYLPAAGDCPSGQVELKGRLTNLCGYTGQVYSPPITVPFSGADQFDAALQAQTAACGVFWFCVDAGTQLTPSFNVPTFAPNLLATLQLDSDGVPGDDEGPSGLTLVCETGLTGVEDQLFPASDPNDAIATISLEGTSSASTGCGARLGWSFTIYGPDGGLVSAPWFFLNGTSAVQDDGGTRGEGVQGFYNLDPAWSYLTVVGSRPGSALPDGGTLCPSLSSTLGSGQFTGHIPLVGGFTSVYYYVVQ